MQALIFAGGSTRFRTRMLAPAPREPLPELPAEQILVEPVGRNPAVLPAALL